MAGAAAFRKQYPGKLCIQTMFMPANRAELEGLADLIKAIHPDEVQLAIPKRPLLPAGSGRGKRSVPYDQPIHETCSACTIDPDEATRIEQPPPTTGIPCPIHLPPPQADPLSGATFCNKPGHLALKSSLRYGGFIAIKARPCTCILLWLMARQIATSLSGLVGLADTTVSTIHCLNHAVVLASMTAFSATPAMCHLRIELTSLGRDICRLGSPRCFGVFKYDATL
ncbi:MAG: hypothetical protein R2857_10745 [Vampirovibrionales bacterium]